MNAVTVRMMKDGSGRALIHWFERLDNGPVKTAVRVEGTPRGPLRLGGAVGRIACQPNRTDIRPAQQSVHESPEVCVHSDDPRAVTCEACKATLEYKAAMMPYDNAELETAKG